MEANQKTLGSYDTHVAEYVSGTTQKTTGDQKIWIDEILSQLPPNAKILELGSGFGRDAKYMQDKGFDVTLTDAPIGFVNYLRDQGFDAKQLNILQDKIPGEYDLIFASAVLLHFPQADFEKALRNIKQGLKPDGLFAFSLKQGEGEKWTNDKLGAPRYFKYWQIDEVEKVLLSVGMKLLRAGVNGGDKWIWLEAGVQENE